MFDSKLLLRYIVGLSLFTLVLAGFDQIIAAQTMAGSIFVLLGALVAYKPTKEDKPSSEFIDKMVKNLNLRADDRRAFFERYSSDLPFNNALLYMQQLSPLDFLRLVRISIEMRQATDQQASSEAFNARKK